ncbi:sulfite exporter TauE/SafE family protein [Methanotorris formicicus]|uniref:Probable membrane transporter protein n=1 Tax=Methanotorris formicicus Mc-S-70 TaxID=647171 RepID=H1KZA9_9EURY|nr:sulfite exporter TauE/SafE family protein [Methanotorris formicicus]EHP86135.1 protein of unknown function DUF81 [Methanotorris formicicus Mc-S-70]
MLFSIFVLLGIVVGILSGLLGVGGGFIVVPSLIYAFDYLNISENFAVKMAFGTSLFVVFITSLVGAYKHSKFKNVDWKSAALMGMMGMVGSYISGTIVVNYLSGGLLKIIFGVILIAISINMIRCPKIREIEDFVKPNLIPLIVCGFLIGILTGMVGLGGGVIAIPVMILFLKFPIKKAIGTSLGMIILTSFGGLIPYLSANPNIDSVDLYNVGYVSLLVGLCIAIPSAMFSSYGVRLSTKLDAVILRRIFGIVLFLVGLNLIF